MSYKVTIEISDSVPPMRFHSAIKESAKVAETLVRALSIKPGASPLVGETYGEGDRRIPYTKITVEAGR